MPDLPPGRLPHAGAPAGPGAGRGDGVVPGAVVVAAQPLVDPAGRGRRGGRRPGGDRDGSAPDGGRLARGALGTGGGPARGGLPAGAGGGRERPPGRSLARLARASPAPGGGGAGRAAAVPIAGRGAALVRVALPRAGAPGRRRRGPAVLPRGGDRVGAGARASHPGGLPGHDPRHADLAGHLGRAGRRADVPVLDQAARRDPVPGDPPDDQRRPGRGQVPDGDAERPADLRRGARRRRRCWSSPRAAPATRRGCGTPVARDTPAGGPPPSWRWGPCSRRR